MPDQTRIVSPGPRDGTVRTADGKILRAPKDWELLAPGDAALTRRVKKGGPTWTVQEPRGRKIFSRGVWAPSDRIHAIRDELEAERSDPAHAKRRAADQARRAKQHEAYVEDFREAVHAFLDFPLQHDDLARRLSKAIAAHATPVGSGTVARTKRISIEERAEAAVIAWMRHQTTAYDTLSIPRVKGKRREVRRMLAEESRRLLDAYRHGEEVAANSCPLQQALES